MKNILLSGFLALFSCIVSANDFVGDWEVSNVEYPNNYYGEIKFPEKLTLKEINGQLQGSYVDQNGFECEFPLSKLINNGNELLLLTCGTTKYPGSWAPLHKVKIIDGKLTGSVITNEKAFTWYALPVIK